MSLLRLASFPLILILVSCASSPMRMDKINEGNWKARALIKDKEHSRSYIVNMDFNAVRNGAVRLDVTSTLGTQVAAMVASPTDVKYVTAENKRYYSGAPTPAAFKPVLNLPIDPRWFENILFEQPITGKGWTCTNNKEGLVEECKDQASGFVVTWSNRKGSQRNIDISHPKGKIQMNFRGFSAKVEKSFDLPKPEGYSEVQLR